MAGDHLRESLPALEAGEVVSGRYRVIGSLGRGGMARVYLAEDTKLGGRLLALKLTRTYDRGEGFIAEARLLSALRHPGLPQIVDYEPPDASGIALIVMAYVEGETLAELMRRHGMRLPFARALRYLLQLARTLQYLHAQNPLVVFRDLKPANVMIDGRDDAILIDFGIAREFKPGAGRDTLMLGTPAFAAPEQLKGEQSDARTDLYGLGALAYHVLTGGGFYAGRQMPSSAWLGDVPPAFRESVLQLLSEHPADRPARAADVVRAWSAFAADEESEPDGVRRQSPRELSSRSPASTRGASRPRSPRIVALISAYPGAGATFASRLLSGRLNKLGVSHALAECPGVEPELYRWLDGDRRMPGRAVFAEPSGMGPVSPAWREGHAAYYPLRPHTPPGAVPEAVFGSWLRGLGVPVALLDVSEAWQAPAVADWLAEHCDAIYALADPIPVKWSERRQRGCMELLEASARGGADTGWIANRDLDFPGRSEWLRLFPEKPTLEIPQLPPAQVASWLWEGGDIALPRRAEAAVDAFCVRWLIG